MQSMLSFGTPSTIDMFVTTVTESEGFDAYVHLGFAGWAVDQFLPALLDSGNSVLIIPRWEDITAISNWQTSYSVLGVASEPWGCPANIVKGPIQVATSDGRSFTITSCEFYACTGDSPQSGGRTANFGAGCISPWSASTWNTPADVPTVLQSPLSYLSDFPFAEFHFIGSSALPTLLPTISEESFLRLHSAPPSGFMMMDIIPGIQWMALRPLSLSIGSTVTQWPGAMPAIAMLDTGGGPTYLSDPSGYLYSTGWPSPTRNPDWTNGSTNCCSTSASVGITLGDASGSFSYEIDELALPASTQGLVLVMCQNNKYMMGEYGMNVGGISMLTIRLLVDFRHAKVGLARAS
jgi:hypothetical protein